MADVGVLNLTIKNNSEQAIQGLDNLVDALTRVKNAIGGKEDSLGLSKVNTELHNFAKTVNKQPVTQKIINSVTKFGEALSKLSKITSVIDFDVQPLADLKAAVGNGINIQGDVGKKLMGIRDAMSGTWNPTVPAHMESLRNAANAFANAHTADKLNDVASALAKYNKAASGPAGSSPLLNVGEPIKKDVEYVKKGVVDYQAAMNDYMEQAKDTKLTFMEPLGAEQLKMDLDSLAVMSNDLERTEESVHRVTEAITQFGNVARVELRETGDIVESVVINRFQEMYQMLGELADRLGMFRNQVTHLMGAQSPLAIGDGTAPGTKLLTDGADNFLSTWVDAGEKWRQNWVEWSSDVAQEMRNAFKPDWTFVEEGVDKAKAVEEALRRVEVMKEALFSKIEKGEIGKDEAIRIAEQIEAFEKSIPIIQDVKIAAQDANNAMSTAFVSTANAQRILQSQTQMAAHDMQRILVLQKEWASMSAEQKAYTMEIYKDNPAVYEALRQMQMAVDASNSVQQSAPKVESALSRIISKLDKVAVAAKAVKSGLQNIKEGTTRLFSPLTKLGRQFVNIAKRMAIRAIIRQFTRGMREGLENLYNYSKAVGTSFAPAMDEAATALQQMKNSLGAAVAPALQALIPILQTVVNWVIQGLNYMNQFFALLNGQKTWTRALPATTSAFGKQEKAAKGAAAAVKDLLADWDELNIIQSETSGSGTGTSNNAEDYLNMFEEVSEFDNKIKGIFEFINDNLDKIKRIAKLVGAAFLGWKFSSAFTGVLGTLSGLATSGLTAAVVFEVSTLFTNKYLETGDTGYLVADLLTTLVGSMFAKKILQTVLGGAAGSIAIPLIFTVSAIASIIANMGHTDVSALDEKSINTSLTSALEGGVAAGYLTHLVGASVGKSLLGGVAGAIATFGISVGLKADAQVAAEGITPENIEAKLISVGALGISGAMVGALAGGGGAGAVGMAMLFGGAPIATFGVAIGINAINEVVDGSAITADVVKNNLLAGGLVGAGLAISTFAVAGATVAGLVAIEAGALTIAALFLIEAIIAKQPAKVKWGNYNATKEEIETFVTNDLMKNPPKVTISLIKATIEPLGSMKTALETNTQNMLGTLYVLQLGLVSDAKESIETEVDTLISSFNEASGQYQKTLEVALSLVPVKNEDGTDTSKEIISNSSSRWSELNGIMTQLGTELADAYKVAYDARLDGNIDETAEKTIEKISNMMTRVANAISSGQARAKASHAIQMQLQNLSKATFDGLIEEYQKQKDELIEELTKVRSESAEGLLAQQYAYEELAQYALEDAHGDVTDATYQHYMEMANQAKSDYLAALANMKEEVEKAADNLVDEDTYQKLREAAIGFLGREITYTVPALDLDFMDEDSEAYKKLWEDLLTGDTAKANVMSKMLNVIKGAFSGEDKDTVADAIKAGILQYSDFLNVDIMDAVAASIGITGEYKDIWDKYVYELLGLNPDGTTPVIEVTPKIQVEDPDISGADISIAPEIANLVNEAKGFTTEDEWEGLYYRMLEKDNIDIDFDYIESAIKGALDEYINANGGSYGNFFGFDFAGIAQSLVDAGYDLDTVLLALEDVLAFAHYNQNWQQPGYDTLLDTWEDRENQDFYKINPNFQGILVNYAGATGMVGEGTTEADMAKATEDGTNAANGDHWTTVEGLIRRLILEMPKEFKISPTSNWGLFNRNANEAAAAVTGDVP